MADPVPGTIVARTVKIAISIQEKRQGDYTIHTVAENTISVPLPAPSKDVGTTIAETLDLMRATTKRFHGDVVVTTEESITTK